MSILPETFHFSIGGFNGPSWDVELKSGVLVMLGFRAGDVSGEETAVTPAPEAWSRFWLAMDAANVWHW